MEYAIVEASGRQFWVEAGKFINVNKLVLGEGTKIVLQRILFVRKEKDFFIGSPYLNEGKIEATVGFHFAGPKVVVFKMKPKKKYRRKFGARQQMTRLHINNITF